MTRFKRLMALRRFIKRQQVLGMTIKKSDWGNGWELGHISTQWTMFTIYVDQTDGVSFYQAIPDIWKGIQCEDEKLVIRTNDMWLLQCQWQGKWNTFFYGPPSTQAKDTWEGKLAQAF